MNHILLLGDSIFDNEAYVTGGPSVIQHLQQQLPTGWQCSLLAFDGAVISDIAGQTRNVPADATNLVISVGGNDALQAGGTALREWAGSVQGALQRMADVRDAFAEEYRAMLQRVLSLGMPTVVCTIYDSVPDLGRGELAALSVFNDSILREAFTAGVAVIDLRLVCNEASDYSKISSIEPSLAGGAKIARAISRVVTTPEAHIGGSRVYAPR